MATRVQTVPLKLSQTKPDFSALVMQLQLFLAQKGTWVDMLTSSTGQTLIEQMAAVGTFNQFAIESAAREAYLDTAVRDSSIYALTRLLGVRITRKAPAGVDIVLTRIGNVTGSYTLPRFSSFDIDGRLFFNRLAVIFRAGQTDSDPAVIYEGQIKIQTFKADSQVFREIYLNEPGFVVSNYDLDVTVANAASGEQELWLPIEDGIWTAQQDDAVYYDSTSGLGDTVLAFGDGTHGRLPSVGFNIVARYATTTGALGNIGGAGLQVKSTSLPDITGVTVTAISGGSDQKPASYYKSLAPNLYKARTRSVTAPDYKAIASSYPGVASVTIQAQRDIAPRDLRWMNIIRLCILPEYASAFTDSEWSAFLTWFTRKQHAAVYVQRFNPIRIYADVTIIVAMEAASSTEEVSRDIEVNVRSLFAKDLATLGKRIALSDIMEACKIVSGVDYVDIVSPSSDFICPSQLHYYELRNLTISTMYSERTFYNVHDFQS